MMEAPASKASRAAALLAMGAGHRVLTLLRGETFHQGLPFLFGPAAPVDAAVPNIQAIGNLLYTRYLFVFEGAGLVLLVAMMISAVWGGSLWVVIWSVGIGFGVNIARVTRPELRRVLHSDFVLAGRASGLTPFQNLWRHLLPNVAPVFIVQLSWGMAVAVLAEAGLSYLGFGAPLTEPSWGLLLKDLQTYISVHPLTVVWPGLAITLTVLGLNLLGDGLREATDPTLSRRRSARPEAQTHTPAVIA